MTRSIITSTVAAAALLLMAGTASAQNASSTITINGSVASKCTVTAGGTAGAFDATVNLNELADADGTLRDNLVSTTAAVGAFENTFSLRCTGSNANVSVTANPMLGNSADTPPAGYTKTIHLTGRAEFDRVGTNSTELVVEDGSLVAGATTGSFGAGNFLANTNNNVRVSVYGFNTTDPAALLLAGAYVGTVVVVVGPTA